MEPGSAIRDGRYRVVRVLGQGAQATTYEAVDVKEGRPVAIKRFVVKGASSWKDVELAEREALVLGRLDHELIPKMVEHFEEGGELFLVTELIEGESLADRARAGVGLTADELFQLLADLADATDYLHGRSPPVIHRDIKPGNVVRRKDGRFCLVDFGAVRAKLEPSGGSTVVGTFGFMAPEQFQGRAMPQSDVYAVGATALVLLTGKQPEDLPHKGLAVDVRAALGSSQRESVLRVLEQLLEPDPDKRPSSLRPLVDWLAERRRLRSGQRGSQRSAETPGRSQGPAYARAHGEAYADDPRGAQRAARGRGEDPFAARRPPVGAGAPPGVPFGAADPRGGPFGPGPHRPAPSGAPSPVAGVGPHEVGRGLRKPPSQVAEVLFGVARVLIALFVVEVVPVLLSVLSIVFGPKLREASYRVRAAGERALRRLDVAEAEFQGRAVPPAQERTAPPHVRVDPADAAGPRVRVEELDDDAEARALEAEREAAELERREEERAARDERRRR